MTTSQWYMIAVGVIGSVAMLALSRVARETRRREW